MSNAVGPKRFWTSQKRFWAGQKRFGNEPKG